VTAEFVDRLQVLDAKNSQDELSIEKFLTKSEGAFFDKVKEDKRISATSLRSHRRSYSHSDAPRSSFYSSTPDRECQFRVADWLVFMFSLKLRSLLMKWG
jgi:alpha-1,3-glucan synthase